MAEQPSNNKEQNPEAERRSGAPRPSDALGFNTPWPVTSVLRRLADATDHLLKDHDCDQHGWEGVTVARDRARAIADAIEQQPSGAPRPEAEEPHIGGDGIPQGSCLLCGQRGSFSVWTWVNASLSVGVCEECRRKVRPLVSPERPEVRCAVSPIRAGEENEGPLQSTDLFLEGRGIILLVNVLAGQQFTYSLHVDGAEQQSSGAVGEPPAAEEALRYSITVPCWNGRRVVTTAPCLYTQVNTCRQNYPDEPDHWCGFCLGHHKADAMAEAGTRTCSPADHSSHT
jgi:hypothetical protein